MHFRFSTLLRLTLVIAVVNAYTLRAQEDHDPAIIARSLVAHGNTARLQRVMIRANRGEPIAIGVIGGSITQGAKASTPEHRYGNLVAQWWHDHFPRAAVTFVNAGVGATGSDYGALRLSRDLLAAHPDLVVVEYAVNDPNQQSSAETLEGIVRQLLRQTNEPAVMLLFMMDRAGHNAQEWLSRVGSHYNLPMVSYRDALWPEIEANRLQWTDICPDEVHPNDRGMADAASFVTSEFSYVLAHLPATENTPFAPRIPAPLFTDLYEHTHLFEGDALQPTAQHGWTYDTKQKTWFSDQPDSSIEFEIEGKVIFTMHYVIKRSMGRARVSIDGSPAQVLDGWFDQTWGGYRQTNRVGKGLAPGKHRVRFDLLEEKSDGSNGHRFEIMGLGSAG